MTEVLADDCEEACSSPLPAALFTSKFHGLPFHHGPWEGMSSSSCSDLPDLARCMVSDGVQVIALTTLKDWMLSSGSVKQTKESAEFN